jgi:tetratricopeptide (TPR) repeat protein
MDMRRFALLPCLAALLGCLGGFGPARPVFADEATGPAPGTAEAGAAAALLDSLPDTPPVAADSADRETALRQQVEQQPSAQAYLDLLNLLEARLAGLEPGDAQLELQHELDSLWGAALADYGDDPLLALANGDRLRARGSLKAAWEAYVHGEALAREDPRWTARMAALTQQAGDFAGAIKLYAESLQTRYDAAVIGQLAECYRLNGDPQAALNLWNRALSQHGEDPRLRMEYGRALYKIASYREALTQYQQGEQLDPGNDLFHNRAALCLYQLGQTADALAEVQRALQLKPQAIYYFNLAVGSDKLGQLDAAEQWYTAGLKAYPQNTQLQQGYSGFLAAHGRGGEAVQQLADSDLSSTSHYANLAALAEEQGNPAAAASAWQSALKEEPDAPWLLTAVAAFYARTNQPEALVGHVRAARSRLDDAAFADLLTAVRGGYIEKKNYSGGVASFQTLLQSYPDVPAVYNNLGLLLHFNGDSASGLALVKRGLVEVNSTGLGRYLEMFLTGKVQGAARALELGPALIAAPDADFAAFELYAGLLAESKRWGEVADVAAQGLARFPQRAPLLQFRTQGLFYTGDYAGVTTLLAAKDYALIDFPVRARLLGLSYLELGNYPKAVAALAIAAQAAPDSAQAQAELGQAQYWQGDLPAARKTLTQALTLDSHSGAAQVWLGWTLLAQGDSAGAQQALREAAGSTSAGTLDHAWTALGQARTAAQLSDAAAAQEYYQQARLLGASLTGADRFQAALATARTELGL